MNKMKYGALAALALGAMVTLTGCGAANLVANKVAEKAIENQLGKNADVNINDNGSATVKTDEGSISTENKIPDTWPKDVPAYPGAKVVISTESTTGDKGISLTLTTSDAADKVFAYYKDELAKSDWKITSSTISTYGNILGATKDTRTFTLYVATSDSLTQITSTVTTKQE